MWKIILIENALRFNLGPLLKYFQMSFVYESLYAVCNGRVSGCCQIESGSTCLLWQFWNIWECPLYEIWDDAFNVVERRGLKLPKILKISQNWHFHYISIYFIFTAL